MTNETDKKGIVNTQNGMVKPYYKSTGTKTIRRSALGLQGTKQNKW
jgi:hypothetical protein